MQLNLPMLTVYSGPRLVDDSVVQACKTYREAVRVCWQLRTVRNMTKRGLAQDAKLYASHVTDYLSESPTKRELPAKCINDFEIACGNRVISQWLAAQAQLTIMEQFIPAARRAA
jgi:hypothetical protein